MNHELKKAVIPAAGYGTRLFPASKAIKKEFFPIVGPDGIARPAILVIVEEALAAGIEEVVIVIQPDDLPLFEQFFHRQVIEAHFDKLPAHFQEYARRLLEIGERVRFVMQPRQEGFGHAVFCAREAVGDHPFLVMLGDRIYRSHLQKSYARQLVDLFTGRGTNLVGLTRIPAEELRSRGVVGGTWLNGHTLLQVSDFVEKPSPEYARNHLQIAGLPQDRFLAVAGLYAVQPEIFAHLEANIAQDRRERGEFQFTTALEQLRQDQPFWGVVIQGETFDIGQPAFYAQSFNAFLKG